MGIMDTIKNAADTSRKITLQSAITLEELFAILENDAANKGYAGPKMKKGLLGKCIEYPKKSRVTPKATIKNNIVTVTKVYDPSSTSIGVGGVSFAMNKDLKGGNAVDTVDAGSEYFKETADFIEASLAEKSAK